MDNVYECNLTLFWQRGIRFNIFVIILPSYDNYVFSVAVENDLVNF